MQGRMTGKQAGRGQRHGRDEFAGRKREEKEERGKRIEGEREDRVFWS